MIPDDLQTTINSWYDFRYVCDDEQFPVFFQRILIRDYFQYQELLRLQPGYAHYDWLVTMYQEQQTKSKTASSDDSITNESSAKTGSDKTSSEGTAGKAGSVITSDSGDETAQTVYGSSTTTEREDSSDETYNNIRDVSDSTGSTTYGKSTDHTPGASTQSETHYEDGANSYDESEEGTASVGKSAPQSISYSGATAGTIPGLDWQYPSTQSQDKKTGKTIHAQENTSTTVNSYLSGVDTTTDSGSDGSTDHTETERTGGIGRTGNSTSTDTHSGDDTQTTRFGKVVTTKYDGMEDTSNNSSTTEYGSGENRDSRTQTTGKTQGEQTLQSTGRTGTIAGILSEAQSFIMASNAWNWLQQELEQVFWGIYEVEI